MRRCKPVAVSRGLARNRRAHCNPVVCWQCQSGSDLAVMNSNLTGFTRNLLWGRCDVRAFWRTPLRDAISRFPGFLSDLLLRFKKSARREGARDPENGKSSFHYRSDFDRPSINCLQARSSSRGSSATLQTGRFLLAALLLASEVYNSAPPVHERYRDKLHTALR